MAQLLETPRFARQTKQLRAAIKRRYDAVRTITIFSDKSGTAPFPPGPDAAVFPPKSLPRSLFFWGTQKFLPPDIKRQAARLDVSLGIGFMVGCVLIK